MDNFHLHKRFANIDTFHVLFIVNQRIPTMATPAEVDRHKSILGTLFTVFSLFHLVFIVIGFIFIGELLPAVIDDQEALMVVNIAKYAVISVTLVVSLPALIAGLALIYKKNWGLTLAFIIGILSLPAFPIWTFVGIYAIVVFIMAQRQESAQATSTSGT